MGQRKYSHMHTYFVQTSDNSIGVLSQLLCCLRLVEAGLLLIMAQISHTVFDSKAVVSNGFEGDRFTESGLEPLARTTSHTTNQGDDLKENIMNQTTMTFKTDLLIPIILHHTKHCNKMVDIVKVTDNRNQLNELS